MSAFTEELRALELDKAGDWDSAHSIVREMNTVEAQRVHAYLHREEGDLGNAGYWYARAGVEMPDCCLAEEWALLHDLFSSH